MSHLFPEDAGQTKCTTTATTQDEQAGKNDQKQGHVGDHREDITIFARNGPDRCTPELRREPCGANLQMR